VTFNSHGVNDSIVAFGRNALGEASQKSDPEEVMVEEPAT
jgi:hypothetical protein